MNIGFREIELKKRYPLAISRGVSAGSLNLFVTVSEDGLYGLGECAPGTGHDETLADIARNQLTDLWSSVQQEPRSLGVVDVYAMGRNQGVELPALAGLDTALWDLLSKQAGMPLHKLLGLSPFQTYTSVTVGINPPEVIRERVPELLARTGAKALKIKLGSLAGIESDQANFIAALESSAGHRVKLRVDANGGWTVAEAKKMIAWLAEHECDYVEQPLAKGEEGGLPELFRSRTIPIFVDESCHFAADVPKLADRVDGVNLKLMKCGGITEALRIVAVARAHGLKTMIGCMGESSVAISAGASIGALFDHIDLDSHLNLNPDPAIGALMEDGRLVPPGKPGHGAELVDA